MPADLATCRLCGATGQDEVFCDGCGALLPVAQPTEELATPQDGDPAAGLVRAAGPSAGEADTDSYLASAVGDQGPDAAPRPGAGLPEINRPYIPSRNPHLPDTPAAAHMHWRAQPLIVPVADPAHAGQLEVRPVLPGVPAPATHAVRGPDLADVATGPACPWCSMPNPLDRHFCRRCAMLLALRPEPAQLPWWRRMFAWGRRLWWRRHELPYAGQRPRLRRGFGRLARWLVIAAVVGLVLFAADTWAGAAVTNVKDHFAHRYPVFPSVVTASHSDPGRPVADLHDGYNNTWWGTGVAGDGDGVHVDATFDQPINLLDIMITPGAGVAQDVFTSQSRPESIEVSLLDANGGSTSTTITLADTPGPQAFAIQGSDVVRVRLTLESAYLAPQSSPPAEVAIAEVEFFASSGG
jgi:hypothetical protein